MSCIVDCNDIQNLTCVTIHDCQAAYFRIQDVKGQIMIYRKDDTMDEILFLSSNLPLFIEPIPPYTEKMVQYLADHGTNFSIVSDSRSFLQDLYIQHPTLTLGLFENNYLELSSADHFISFIFLQFGIDIYDRLHYYRRRHKDVKVYIHNIRVKLQVQHCMAAQVHGVLVLPSRVLMVMKTLDECNPVQLNEDPEDEELELEVDNILKKYIE